MRNELNNITNKLFKADLSNHKIELAETVSSLITKAENGNKLANEAKIAINELKAMSKQVADKVDNFAGVYFDVVIKGQDTIKAANDLGLGDSPEIQKLKFAQEKFSKLRNELKNGSDWLIK